MPEINANIVVEPIQLSIVPNEPTITVAPEPLNLNIYTGGIAAPSGNTGDIQYNAGGDRGIPPTECRHGRCWWCVWWHTYSKLCCR